MPRVPGGYVASQGAPGNAPLERASGAAFGQVQAEIVHHGAQQIEGQALLAQRHIQYVEAEEARKRQRDFVTKGIADATEQLNQAEFDLQTGRRDEQNNLVEPPAKSADYVSRWKDKAKEISDNLIARGGETADIQALTTGLTHLFTLRGNDAWRYSKGMYVQETNTAAYDNGAQAIRNYLAAKDPLEAQTILDNHIAWLKDTEGVLGTEAIRKHTDSFNNDVFIAQATRMSQTAEGRQQLIAWDDEGKFANVDPVKYERMMARVAAKEQRSEGLNRANEAAIKAQHNLWELEIGTKVSKGDISGASRQLEFLADLNVLPAEIVNKYRAMIVSPPLDKISDQPTRARVSMDVNSLNPRISEQQIKNYQTDGLLSIQDASHFLATRNSNVLRAQRLKGEDPLLWKRQAQAEQNLQAMLHVDPGSLAMMPALEGDRRSFLYDQLLSELTDRSRAFNGDEDPITAVESMRKRVNDAFSKTTNSQLTPHEVDSLYPNQQELGKAYRMNRIDKDTFEEAVKRQAGAKVQLPRLAPAEPAAQPTQRKSRTHGTQ